MTVDRMWDFDREETLPSWWTDALEAFLSTAQAGMLIEPVGPANTSLRVPAAAGTGTVAVSVRGRWRWVEATITKAVSGGAGIKDIYATCAENSINSTPLPFSDHTNYAFDLSVQASGVTPTIVPGTLDLFRKIGEADWDGAKITRIRQLVGRGPLVRDLGWTLPAGFTPRRTLPAGYSMNDMRDYFATMLSALIDNGNFGA